MTRISEFYPAIVALEGEPGDILELEATFDIEGSYHSSRFAPSVSLSATFLRAQWGGLTITRDMAEAICGKDHLHRIEASVADQYVRDFYPECAA
jgi:hypothetical protein